MSVIQVITLTVAIVVILVELAWMWKNKETRYLALPTIFWMLHIVAFYLTIALEVNPDQINHTMWSSILRLHGILSILSYAVYRLHRSYHYEQ